MNIKNIFKEKNVTENKSADNLKTEIAPLDVPKVVFEDLELQVTLGQWLGVLSSQEDFETSEKSEKIVTKFGQILKLVGIDNAETCTLNQFDRDNFSFNCHFNNSGNDANISLKWGNIIDFGPEFIIDYQNENKTYEYYKGNEEKPTRLNLQHYTIKNVEDGNSFVRFLSPYEASFTLQNGEYSFSINIVKPESIKADSLSGYTFKIRNEEELQQYLLGLSFPFEINEVYKKICEISIDSISEYPSFRLRTIKRLDKKTNKTTDMISLSHGQLEKIVMTKNEKTIAIDSNGNWSYDSSKLSVSQSDKGAVNYSLNSISEELLKGAIPFEQYTAVNQEVEQVRKIVKTMLSGE